MSYLEPIQTHDAAGIPRTEPRCLPELGDYEDISLQFSVCSQQYTYPLPRFTFRQLVATKEQWQARQHDSDTELDLLSICAIELVEQINAKDQLTKNSRHGSPWLQAWGGSVVPINNKRASAPHM